MLGGLCWAGECEGLSAGMFEVGTGAEEEFELTAGKGDDVLVRSLAG